MLGRRKPTGEFPVQQLTPQPWEPDRPAAPPRGLGRLLANRKIWKDTIYGLALLTYLCSFLFFGLAVAEVSHAGATGTAIIDLLAALYFLLQVVFLFSLSAIVERRRQILPIEFPDRRQER